MRSFLETTTLDPVPGVVVATLRAIDLAAGAEAHLVGRLPPP